MKYIFLIIVSIGFLYINSIQATTFHANKTNYKSFIPQLSPGDSLILEPGIYTQRLKLVDILGKEGQPIVILGGGDVDDVVFVGNACCNTVSLTRCAWLKLENFTIDGKFIKYIDAVKAEGTAGSWTHHITIEGLKIIGHGNDQQTVGISTKCPSWNWVIRRNIIIEAGTGIYLGNSNGEAPFINGLVEYNLIINTVGYNMQIKRQNDNTRNIPGILQEGTTIIRYNTFSKAKNASSGGNARPNLLVGGFPPNTAGENDHYEIYGNFFWQNPVEKLFQGTGNIAFYNNVLVNEHAGGGGIQIQNHHGRAPRNIYLFNNTIMTEGRSINFSGPDLNFEQRVEGNAVFTSRGIRNAAFEANNLVKTITEAKDYLVNPIFDIDDVDMSPIAGQLNGTMIETVRYKDLDRHNYDFDGRKKDWAKQGAYTTSGDVLWHLALERRPEVEVVSTGIQEANKRGEHLLTLYPNMVKAGDYIQLVGNNIVNPINIYDMRGVLVSTVRANGELMWIVPELQVGTYLVVLHHRNGPVISQKIMVW